MHINRLFRLLLFVSAIMIATSSACFGCLFRTVPDDPYDTKMYTLPDGLKITMTVNKDAPLIQTGIAVRVGGQIDQLLKTLQKPLQHLL